MARRRISTKRKGRRFSGCAPKMQPCKKPRSCATPVTVGCDKSDTGCGASFSSVGPVATGFDSYGYPVVKNFRLPKPFTLAEGRQYGATRSIIQPMRLVTVDSSGRLPQTKPALARLSTKFKLKPSPSVPGAPDSLPSRYKFCIQKGDSGYFYRFRDAKTSLHGAEADVMNCVVDPQSGLTMCEVRFPSGAVKQAPLCDEPGADKEPFSQDCCVLIKGDGSGQLVCPGSSYDLLVVQVLPGTEHVIEGVKHVSVQHPDLPGGGARPPVCEPMDEIPEERPCCIEERTGLIICPEGVDFPLAGKKIPLNFLEFVTDPSGARLARLRCGNIENIAPSDQAANPTLEAMYNICDELGGYIFQVCDKKPKREPTRPPTPRPKFPDICCFDPETNTLVCEGTEYHGLEVEVITHAVVGGKEIVSVKHPRLPGGGVRIPLCPPTPKIPPADCCFDPVTNTIVCEDSEFNGLSVIVVSQTTHNGKEIVSVKHPRLPGGGMRIPLCPTADKRPPECCYDKETGTLVCPGSELHGLSVQVVSETVINGQPIVSVAHPRLPGGGMRIPYCPPEKRRPPECCFDPATGKLVCEGTELHGLTVEVVTETVVNGQPIASVKHPKLPGGGMRVPLCPPKPPPSKVPPPADCCVVESSAGLRLMCDPTDHPWNGKDVTNMGQCIDSPNGRICVIAWEDERGRHTLEIPVCPPPKRKIPPPESGDIPPPPDSVPIPRTPPPRLPPSKPGECEQAETSRCRQRWDEMVSRPAKLTKCDKKWFEMLRKLKKGNGCGVTCGRRMSGLRLTKGKSNPKSRKYGMGVSPENRKYARFPGLRGGRKTI